MARLVVGRAPTPDPTPDPDPPASAAAVPTYLVRLAA